MNLLELIDLVSDLEMEAEAKDLDPEKLVVKILTQPSYPLKGGLDNAGGINRKGEIILGCSRKGEYGTEEDEELLDW